jgi:hypothetical protein
MRTGKGGPLHVQLDTQLLWPALQYMSVVAWVSAVGGAQLCVCVCVRERETMGETGAYGEYKAS